MANLRSRAIVGERVVLKIQYYDSDGIATDPDSTPEVRINNPRGETVIKRTSIGVTRDDVGLFSFYYDVQSDSILGLWEDSWETTIKGVQLINNFSFLVLDSQNFSAVEGSIALGDDVNFDFSEEELVGINILLKYLKCRLRSEGKKPKRDQFGSFIQDAYGEILYEDCDVFSDEILACFLCQALSEFNMIPFFTGYTFADPLIKTLFSASIVEGAYVFALASQSLVEKGRDFSISDGGVSYQPPQLGDFLNSHYGTWLNNYRERLKFIKNNIRPGPVGFGTFTNLSSGAPAFTRLRHLRSRRII